MFFKISCQLFLKDFQTSQKSQKAQRSTQVEGVRLQCNVLEYGSVLGSLRRLRVRVQTEVTWNLGIAIDCNCFHLIPPWNHMTWHANAAAYAESLIRRNRIPEVLAAGASALAYQMAEFRERCLEPRLEPGGSRRNDLESPGSRCDSRQNNANCKNANCKKQIAKYSADLSHLRVTGR